MAEWVIIVKNCKSLQFYSNELACYNFIDTDRRYKTPGSETKDLRNIYMYTFTKKSGHIHALEAIIKHF